MDFSSTSFFVFSSFASSDVERIPGSYMDGYIHPCGKPDIPSWFFDKETEIIKQDEINEKFKNYELVPGMKIGILRKYDDFSMVILGKIYFSKVGVCKSIMDIREKRAYVIEEDPMLLNVFIDILFDKKIIPETKSWICQVPNFWKLVVMKTILKNPLKGWHASLQLFVQSTFPYRLLFYR